MLKSISVYVSWFPIWYWKSLNLKLILNIWSLSLQETKELNTIYFHGGQIHILNQGFDPEPCKTLMPNSPLENNSF